jgi:hypothetical protein
MTTQKIYAGGTSEFSFTCYRSDGTTLTAHDVSAATEITATIIDRKTPSTALATSVCSIGYAGADWANGLVTGKFDNSDTALITEYGYANIEIKVTIAGEPEYFGSEDKSIKVVSVAT